MDFNLTNPGIQYDGTIDPTTGQPIALPRQAFFKNPNLRNIQFAEDVHKALPAAGMDVAPTSLASVTDNGVTTNGEVLPPDLQFSGGGPSLQPPTLPKFIKPTFQQTTQDSNGLPTPVNAGQTKLGKLAAIIASAARGAAAGAGGGTFGQGYELAREAPIRQAAERQQIESGAIQNQVGRASLAMLPFQRAAAAQAIYKSNADIAHTNLESAKLTYDMADNSDELLRQAQADAARFKEVDGQLYDISSGQPRLSTPGTTVPIDEDMSKASGLPVGSHVSLKTAKDLKSLATVPLDKQEADVWLANNPGKTLVDYQRYQKTLVPAFNFNLQQGAGGPPQPDFAAGTPKEDMYKAFGAKGGTVRAIVEGRQSAPSSFAQKTPYWQDVMQKVFLVDPQWSEQRAQVRKQFATGPDGRNIGNLNTAVVHLDALAEAAKGLANGRFTPGNEAWNKVKTLFGDSAPTTFEGVRSAYAGEAASALKGTATDPEIENIRQTIMSKSSPDQLAAYSKEMAKIFSQKMETYRERAQQQGLDDYDPVLPQAKSVFDKYATPSSNPQQSSSFFKQFGGAVRPH